MHVRHEDALPLEVVSRVAVGDGADRDHDGESEGDGHAPRPGVVRDYQLRALEQRRQLAQIEDRVGDREHGVLREGHDLLGEGFLTWPWSEHGAPTVALEEGVTGGCEVPGRPHLRGAKRGADHDGDQAGVRAKTLRVEAGLDGGAGRVLAQLIRRGLYSALAAAIDRGVPMIAPCNGFQIAVQAGLLPGPADGESWPTEPAVPAVALAPNERGRFHDVWTGVEIPESTRCIWTAGLGDVPAEAMVLPSAHGEGRFVATDETTAALESEGRIALRYTEADHFNGSRGRVAGICDASGLVFGLMPHPERYTRWSQHPTWTRLEASVRSGDTPGLAMFRNAVHHATAVVG